MKEWYTACERASEIIIERIPEHYRSRNFAGLIGDIKALSSSKAISLFARKKGLCWQLSYLYLKQGIDNGAGYQSCASDALRRLLSSNGVIIDGNILDIGCAVGVTAGVLGLDRVTAFDIFKNLLETAQLVDSLCGKNNHYAVADMTGIWPFSSGVFDNSFGGLVCHHLKNRSESDNFLREANRTLKKEGRLILTFPSGSISTAANFKIILDVLRVYGFRTDDNLTGMVMSNDNSHSLFWMFIVTAVKHEYPKSYTGCPDFSVMRTQVSREDKGIKIKASSSSERKVVHENFSFIPNAELASVFGEKPLVYGNIIAVRRAGSII